MAHPCDRLSRFRARERHLDREANDIARKSRTILKYDKLEYNLPLKDDNFTLQAL